MMMMMGEKGKDLLTELLEMCHSDLLTSSDHITTPRRSTYIYGPECSSEAWRRMRTPSPENIYNQRTGAPPAAHLLAGALKRSEIMMPRPPGSWLPLPANQDVTRQCGDDDNTPSSLAVSVECTSIGTIGHPHTCGEPCKYVNRAKGCKDGLNCSRCHLCRWKKSSRQRQSHEPLKP